MTFFAKYRMHSAGIAVLAVIFVAGLMAGSAWTRTRGRNGINVDVNVSTELPRELKRLGLTPAQEDSLRAILSAGGQRMRAVLSEFEPRFKATIDSVNTSVRSVLNAEQRQRFDAARVGGRDEIEVDTVRR